MSLYTASLNSGSNGNCYYIGNDNEAVLIDVGISCREVERRMLRLNLAMNNVKAIFISHEHSDHIKGVEVLSKKYDLPVFITERTLKYSGLNLNEHLPFKAYGPVIIGALSVTAFPKHHDASDPHSFVIKGGDIKIGVLTDIGAPCSHVIKNFKECDAAFLEANYDEEMLDKGRYPFYLKNRIKSGKGHLSNTQALDIFINQRQEKMSHLFLSHLSKDNNCPDLVHELFQKHAGKTNIVVASRYEETAVYTIEKENSLLSASRSKLLKTKMQLELF